MSNRELLQKSVDLLEEVFTATHEHVQQDFPGINPFVVKDTTGRSILLDALSELVRARAVLAEIDKKEINETPNDLDTAGTAAQGAPREDA